MMTWKWVNPGVLWFLPLVPFLIYGIFIFYKRKQEQIEKIFGHSVYQFLTATNSPFNVKWKIILETLALVFFLVALARPQFGESQQKIKSQGVEVMVLFDVSESMLAEDMAPSRLDFAKKELNRFLDLLPGSKVGLVAFAGSAALVSPITTDASALKMFTEFLDTQTVSSQGTDFKKALEEAETAFERGGQGNDPATRVTRVILLISDGENQEEGAFEVVERLLEKGVRIFSIAVGSEKGGAIPQRDINGILRGYKKNKNGEQIVTSVNGNALKELAQKGKGSFYFASLEGTYLKNLVVDINKLDKSDFDTQMLTLYEERYQGFLFIGFLFAFFAIFIKSRKGGVTRWRGRFEVPK
jgi:Ca-activated chloride channel family protein